MAFAKGNKIAKGGRRAGSGRKKLATRELCQLTFHDRIPRLADMIDSDETEDQNVIAAMRVLGAIGVPQQLEHDVKLPADITLKIAGLDAKD